MGEKRNNFIDDVGLSESTSLTHLDRVLLVECTHCDMLHVICT